MVHKYRKLAPKK